MMLRVAQSILPSKTQKEQEMTTTKHHTRRQLITLKVENLAVDEKLVDTKEETDKTLHKGEEELRKNLRNRGLEEALCASYVTHQDIPTCSTAQNSQSIFQEEMM